MSDMSLRELFEHLMRDPSAREELEDRGLDDLDDPVTAEALTHVAATLPPDVAEHFSPYTTAASPVPSDQGRSEEPTEDGDDSLSSDLADVLASAPEPTELDTDPAGEAATDAEPSEPTGSEAVEMDTELADSFGSGAAAPSEADGSAGDSAGAADLDVGPVDEPSAEESVDPLDELSLESPVEMADLDGLDPVDTIDDEQDQDDDGDVIDG